ncbi:MAG: LacI family DNA-binding transcriptional regulator, partial [Chloroflexota bacterium]
MGITIKDVAAVAGVSPATVSRFLTGNAKVAEETAQQIRQVIEELGYQPDRVARALRQRKTQLLGYIVPNLNNLIAMQLLIALEREASERGFLIAVSSAGNLANTEVVQIERLVAQGIDGLFIFPSGGEQTCDALTRVLGDEIPVVQIGQLVNGVAADYVGVD